MTLRKAKPIAQLAQSLPAGTCSDIANSSLTFFQQPHKKHSNGSDKEVVM